MTQDRLIHSFGRRRGRKLRAGRAALLDTLLPQLSVTLPESGSPLDPGNFFAPQPRDVWLEIGFGGGEHLAWQAAQNPDIGLIGCEPYENGVVALLGHIRDRRLTNIRIWNDDARVLLARLAPSSIGRAFVLFPDPWPKARHHKRRFVSPETVAEFHRLLQPEGQFLFASDIADYVAWTRHNISVHGGFSEEGDAAEPNGDWIETRYEAKARQEGRRSSYLRFRRLG